MPGGFRHRLADRTRAAAVALRATTVVLTVTAAALLLVAVAGCGGGEGDTGATASSTTASSAAPSTTSTDSGDAGAAAKELGSPAAVRSVVETVLTSTDPADACGRYVTRHYLSAAYGGEEACVQAQRPGIAATSLSSFRIDSEKDQAKAVGASARLHGGPYDGARAKVGLVFDSGRYRVDSLGANVPVGP